MPTWSADRELELACKVGCLTNLERAIEEGADVNCEGGSPLFLAIMKGHRHVIERLIELEASPEIYLSKAQLKNAKSPEQIVDALMEGAPPPVEEGGARSRRARAG